MVGTITNKRKLLFLGVATAIITTFQNCGPSGLTTELDQASSSVASSVDGNLNQLTSAPKIQCSLNKGGQVLRTITQRSYLDIYNGEIYEGDQLTLSCVDDVASDGTMVTAGYSVYDGTSWQPLSSNKATFSFPAAGDYPRKIKVTDINGKETVKDVTLLVRCKANPATALSVNSLSLSKSLSSKAEGWFDVSVAVSGGSGSGYMVSMDYNNDGISDNFYNRDSGKWDPWSAKLSQKDVFMPFSGNRKINVIAKDSCNNVVNASFDVNINTLRVPAGTAVAAIPSDYFYLQGDISAKSGKSDVLTSPEVTMTETAGMAMPEIKTDRRRVSCDYSVSNGKAGLMVRADNSYYDNSVGEIKHGVFLGVNDIMDDGSASPNVGSPNMTSARYFVSGAGDRRVGFDFSGGNCQVQIDIKRLKTIGKCGQFDSNGVEYTYPIEAINIKGKYGCQDMKASEVGVDLGYGSVDIDEGYFFCQQNLVGKCPGGGGAQPPAPKEY